MINVGASIQHHQVLYTVAGYYVFSAAVGAMPTPATNGNMFYRWLFGFLQAVGANLTRVVASKYPEAFAPSNTTNPPIKENA